ncbi:hypothetical protein AOLI_G00076470 [Acnodon oligacanthus]
MTCDYPGSVLTGRRPPTQQRQAGKPTTSLQPIQLTPLYLPHYPATLQSPSGHQTAVCQTDAFSIIKVILQGPFWWPPVGPASMLGQWGGPVPPDRRPGLVRLWPSDGEWPASCCFMLD